MPNVVEERAEAKRARRPKKKRKRFTASTADRYELYQLSVQSPEMDVEFLSDRYREVRGRHGRHFREDFCGTALLSSHWVRQGPRFTAEGFDLDPEPLAWGREHNLAPLGRAAPRVALHQKDVRAPGDRPPDVRVAQNFSYWVFKRRRELLDYFRVARESLAEGGLFFVDLFGGDEAMMPMKEKRKIDEGFTYVWDQARFQPGTGDYLCHIHFHFKDGTKLKKAFTYDWRFWTMPELKDLLAEAGFSEVHSYFEESEEDADDDEEGEFVLDETGKAGEDCAGWIAYLVAYD